MMLFSVFSSALSSRCLTHLEPLPSEIITAPLSAKSTFVLVRDYPVLKSGVSA